MGQDQIASIVYLLLLLVVIGYFTFGDYKKNLSRAVKHAIVWLAIILVLFVTLRLFGY